MSYYGTVNSGSVAVPLDANLPAEDLCELIDRADATVLIYDKARAGVAKLAEEKCPKLKYRIAMEPGTEELSAQTLSFEDFLAGQEPGFACEPKPEELATIMLDRKSVV